ncbi:hypothetical protein SHKM778_28810 [Streptomyces sp. KM77-8]|uniref:Uncharacterized protein n=1 Tax=Streptomyces haneummycinicus TaxID=3074435 RepID=A0AAT9HGF9_9ACTN
MPSHAGASPCFFCAVGREEERRGGVGVVVGVESRGAYDDAQPGDGRQEVGPQSFRALGIQKSGRPLHRTACDVADHASATELVVPTADRGGYFLNLVDVVGADQIGKRLLVWGETVREVYGGNGGQAAGLEERASVHGLGAPKARRYFVTAQDATSMHLNRRLRPLARVFIGIRTLFIGIAEAEGHRPCPLEEATSLQHLVQPLGHLQLARGVLPFLDRQDHVIADLRQPPQGLG